MRILIIHHYVPRPDRGGSDLRMMQLINELTVQGHHLSYLCVYPEDNREYVDQLNVMGITVFNGDRSHLYNKSRNSASMSSLSKALVASSYDAVLLTLWFWDGLSIPEVYLLPIRKRLPTVAICILSDDRHGERRSMLGQLTGSRIDLECSSAIELAEQLAYEACDMVVTISEEDKRGIQRLAPLTPTFVVPFAAPVHAPETHGTVKEGLLLLGNFLNDAVQDGVIWFLEHVWPDLLKRCPHIRLTLAGNASDHFLGSSVEGVVTTGYVRDVDPLFERHKIFVSPIRYGTGISTKAVMALSRGIPLITTPCGAQGLSLRDGVDALIASDATSFVERLSDIYANDEALQLLGARGRHHLEERFSPTTFSSSLTTAVAFLSGVRPQSPFTNPGWPSQSECDGLAWNECTHATSLTLTRFYQQLLEAAILKDKSRLEEALNKVRHALLWSTMLVDRPFTQNIALSFLAQLYRCQGDSTNADLCLKQMLLATVGTLGSSCALSQPACLDCSTSDSSKAP